MPPNGDSFFLNLDASLSLGIAGFVACDCQKFYRCETLLEAQHVQKLTEPMELIEAIALLRDIKTALEAGL